MRDFASGAIAISFAYSAIFFLKSWKRGRDTLFFHFSAAFTCLALERLISVLHSPFEPSDPSLYLLRLIAFVLILKGIWDKNQIRSRQ